MKMFWWIALVLPTAIHALRDYVNESYYESWHVCDSRWPSTCCPDRCSKEAVMSGPEAWTICEDSLPIPCEMHIFRNWHRNEYPCRLTEAWEAPDDDIVYMGGRKASSRTRLTPTVFAIPEEIVRTPIPDAEVYLEIRNPPWQIDRDTIRDCIHIGPWVATITQWMDDWEWNGDSTAICWWAQPQVDLDWKQMALDEHIHTGDHMWFNLTRIMQEDGYKLPFNSTWAFWIYPRDDCYAPLQTEMFVRHPEDSWPVLDWKYIKNGKGRNMTADPSFQAWLTGRRKLQAGAVGEQIDLAAWIRAPRGRISGAYSLVETLQAIGIVSTLAIGFAWIAKV